MTLPDREHGSGEVRRARDPVATRRILEALPDWFGDQDAIDKYVADAADTSLMSLVATSRSTVVGVALIKRHFPESAELHLLAVDPSRHRQGVGHALVNEAADALAADGCRLLSVHTVGPSYEHIPYQQTRAFYAANGFIPLEEHFGLGWSGPMLIAVRALA